VEAAFPEHVGYIVGSHRNSLARPTQTQRDAYTIAREEFKGTLGRLRTLIDTDLWRLQGAIHEAWARWIPGLTGLVGETRGTTAEFHGRTSTAP
jgi:hypothetical protein